MMPHKGEVDIKLYTLLTSALGGDEWSASHYSQFIPRPWNHMDKRLVIPTANMDVVVERRIRTDAANGTIIQSIASHYTDWTTLFIEAAIITSIHRVPKHIICDSASILTDMRPDGSLLHSQEPTAGSYSEADEYTTHTHNLFCQGPFEYYIPLYA
jgi:hypothetical protein